MIERPSMCLLSGKLRYETSDEADAMLAVYSQAPGRKTACRTYCCPDCAGWHLTSLPVWKAPA